MRTSPSRFALISTRKDAGYEEPSSAGALNGMEACARALKLTDSLATLCHRAIIQFDALGPKHQLAQVINIWEMLHRDQRSYETFCEMVRAYEEISNEHSRRIFRCLILSAGELFPASCPK